MEQMTEGLFGMVKKIKAEGLWFLKETDKDLRSRFLAEGRTVSCRKGVCCIRAREENPDLYFVLEGKVQIYNLTRCGKKKILFILGPDHMANEGVTAAGIRFSVKPWSPAAFFVIRRESFLSLMQEDFHLAEALLRYQERKLWRLEHQLKNTVGSIYLERKLASKLWKLARDFGIPLGERHTDRHGSERHLPGGFSGGSAGNHLPRLPEACGLRANRDEQKKVFIPDPEKMSWFYRNGSLKN